MQTNTIKNNKELENYIIKDGKETFIKFAGLLKLGYKKGIKEFKNELIQMPNSENDFVAVVKTTIVTKANEIFENYGTASPRNTGEDFTEYLIEVAVTRSSARALRLLTGIGFTCLEELSRDKQKQILNMLEDYPTKQEHIVVPLDNEVIPLNNTLNLNEGEDLNISEENFKENIPFNDTKEENKEADTSNKNTSNKNLKEEKTSSEKVSKTNKTPKKEANPLSNTNLEKEDEEKEETNSKGANPFENADFNEKEGVPLENKSNHKVRPEQINYIKNLANIIATNTKKKTKDIINNILIAFNIKRLEDLEENKVADVINVLKKNIKI